MALSYACPALSGPLHHCHPSLPWTQRESLTVTASSSVAKNPVARTAKSVESVTAGASAPVALTDTDPRVKQSTPNVISLTPCGDVVAIVQSLSL
mmetsp:Transcript_66930/g.160287  ORF Transcript_66930/g.160287 Transcript_66930/m.160287 type:complete len:95 (-) Transcript_66930:608-892(-)